MGARSAPIVLSLVCAECSCLGFWDLESPTLARRTDVPSLRKHYPREEDQEEEHLATPAVHGERRRFIEIGLVLLEIGPVSACYT